VKGGTGPADALYIDDLPVPPISGNQALVKIKAFGLNRMDLLQREGQYPLPPQAPETMGVEFSGTIEDLGPDANGAFKVGDEVFGLAYGGQLMKPVICLTIADHLLHRGLCSVHCGIY
jgi:NADPH2:quinone reductase